MATAGFRLERHRRALYDGRARCAATPTLKAKLSTGITVEYSVFQQDAAAELEKERVVLITGFAAVKESWGVNIEILLREWDAQVHKKALEILIFDNRGSGGSDVPWGRYTTSQQAQDTLAMMDVVGWQQAHIVGHSMGGMTALELASQAPKRVLSLTLCNTSRGKYKAPTKDPNNAPPPTTETDPAVVGMHKLLCALYPKTFLDRKMEDSDKTPREILLAWHCAKDATPNEQKKPPMIGIINQQLAIKTHFVSDERLMTISQAGFPILIMGGGVDAVVAGADSEILREKMPGDHVKLVMFEDAGHILLSQYQDEATAEIIAVMERGDEISASKKE